MKELLQLGEPQVSAAPWCPGLVPGTGLSSSPTAALFPQPYLMLSIKVVSASAGWAACPFHY